VAETEHDQAQCGCGLGHIFITHHATQTMAVADKGKRHDETAMEGQTRGGCTGGNELSNVHRTRYRKAVAEPPRPKKNMCDTKRDSEDGIARVREKGRECGDGWEGGGPRLCQCRPPRRRAMVGDRHWGRCHSRSRGSPVASALHHGERCGRGRHSTVPRRTR
jgi:hypothetical protein